MNGRQLGAAELAPESKLLVTVVDVATMLSIGRTVAWELVRTRTIRSVKIGRTRRVPMTALQEYVAQLIASDDVA
jgi:excisionase family DNA binding protein